MIPPHVNLKTMASISVALPNNLEKICIEGVAEVEIVDVYKDNGREVTTTLRFSSAEKINVNKSYGFIYEDLAEKLNLIGAKERPFPTISKKQNTGVPGSSSAVISYEVKWLSAVTPPRCHVVTTT